MASCRRCNNWGFGTSRWRLQGNATLGLRAGGRGHHLFFLAEQGSAPGTNQHTTGGQSMSALPRYIRRQLAPLSRSRHRPQCPDNGRCSRSLCGRARAGRPEDCRCADRSTSPLFVGGNGCRKAWVQVRFRQSIQRQAARIGVSSCSGPCRGGSGRRRRALDLPGCARRNRDHVPRHYIARQHCALPYSVLNVAIRTI